MERTLSWEGCCNARDLGGLPIGDDRQTTYAALVRADALDTLTADGWKALYRHGVRKIIDLRNDNERTGLSEDCPSDVTVVAYPLDGAHDRDFWEDWDSGPQFGTPLYYQPFLERCPDRVARVMQEIATAPAGGVVYHCGRGRDRTGLITVLLLALAGVEPRAVADDYMLSVANVKRLCELRGERDEGPHLHQFLRSRGTTAHQLVSKLASTLSVDRYLTDAGLTAEEVGAIRGRLVSPARTDGLPVR